MNQHNSTTHYDLSATGGKSYFSGSEVAGDRSFYHREQDDDEDHERIELRLEKY